jgi:hypothetical protein
MGEVLRAILEENCVDSRVAFYAAQVTAPLLATGPGWSLALASIPCKIDTWFLCVGWAFSGALTNAPSVRWVGPGALASFQVSRANNGEMFQQPVVSPLVNSGTILPQIPSILQNFNCNDFVSLDEYVLFEPGELIQIAMSLDQNTAGGAGTVESFLTLQGVEYQFADGKGYSRGQGKVA